MREFKFRAWYKPHLKKGIVQKFIQKEIDHELYFVAEDDDEIKYKFFIPFIDNDWIVEQNIGMKVKHNVELFDGDIVKIDGEDRLVVIRVSKQRLYYYGHFLKNKSFIDLERYRRSTIKVIGNIHEKGNKYYE